jgi:hypothetical protein
MHHLNVQRIDDNHYYSVYDGWKSINRVLPGI